MEYSLVWTPEARSTLEEVVSYLDKANPQAGDKLLMQVDRSLSLIIRMPFMYTAIPEKAGLRRCLVGRHIAMYYRIDGGQVTLLSFFDTRQDPASFNP
jgi:plasmid stabilization system protein ParE